MFEKYEKQLKAAKSSGKNTKATQDKILANAQRQQQKRGGKKGSEPVDDAGAATSSAPQKWSDYSVQFHFPEPTELTPPLMQLIDVDFKYPGTAATCLLWKYSGSLSVVGVIDQQPGWPRACSMTGTCCGASPFVAGPFVQAAGCHAS